MDRCFALVRLPRYGFLDFTLSDGVHDPACGVDFHHLPADCLFHLVGQGLDIIRTSQGIDRVAYTHLVDEYLHRAQGNLGCLLGRDGIGFVVRAERHRLRAGKRTDECVVRAADDVVLRLCLGQTSAAAAGDHPHPAGFVVNSVVCLADDFRPQASAAPELSDLFEKISIDVKIERKTRGEGVDIQTALQGLVDIRLGDAEGIRHFLHRVCARFADVVTADADRAVFRYFVGAVFDDIDHHLHRCIHREYPRTPADELLQDVILCRTPQVPDVEPALLCHSKVHRDEDDR